MSTFKTLTNMISVELEMEVKSKAKYLVATLADFTVFTFAYLAVLFFSDTGDLNTVYRTNDGVMLILIGYMFWTLGVMAMDLSTQTIEADSRAGILETELQSSFPLWFLMLIRVWVLIVLTGLYLLILGIITGAMTGVSIGTVVVITFEVLLISIISNIGMFGIGLIFGAGSLIFKSVGTWATLLQTGILLIANVGSNYSSNLQALIPFGLGIEITRSLFLGRQISLATIMGYLAVNLVYLLIGILIFNGGLRHERKFGSFERF